MAFFENIIRFLNEERIPHMLTGSMAMGLYIVPRSTDNIDIVVELRPTDEDKFASHFGSRFYRPIQLGTGQPCFVVRSETSEWSTNFFTSKNLVVERKFFSHPYPFRFRDSEVFVAKMEAILLTKIIDYNSTRNAQQAEDIIRMYEAGGFDSDYIHQRVAKPVFADDWRIRRADTPESVRRIHLIGWLSKRMEERLRLQFISNEQFYAFAKSARREMAMRYPRLGQQTNHA